MSAATDRYLAAKAEAPDGIVLMRMGDFYEAMFGDANIVAEALGITLTTRGAREGSPVPMAGFPVHSEGRCVGILETAGHKVTFA